MGAVRWAFDQALGVAYSDIRSLQLSPDGPPAEYAGDRMKIDWQGNVKMRPRKF